MEPRYGHWTILDPNDHRETTLAQCDCGTQRRLRRRNLTQGRTTSCGCQRNLAIIGKTWNTAQLAPDHSPTVTPGARFGRWTVLTHPQPHGKRRVVQAQCDCGTTATVATDNLRAGVSKSCGCLKVDAGRERFKRNQTS